MGKFSATSGVVTIFIVTLMITYLIDELHLLKSPVALKVNWWLHSGVIGGFLFLIPKSKHMHLVLSPFNIFLKPYNGLPISDLISEEELDNVASSTMVGGASIRYLYMR